MTAKGERLQEQKDTAEIHFKYLKAMMGMVHVGLWYHKNMKDYYCGNKITQQNVSPAHISE